MPLAEPSGYHAPLLFRSGHVSTIWPVLFRRIRLSPFRRERIDTPDGDFLDLDCLGDGGQRVAILLHGLEGCSQTHYMRGMAAAFSGAGWDVVAMNFRGCSGEPNRRLRSYHSGATEDLATVLDHVWRRRGYDEVALVGFSLGGNLLLKYLGDAASAVDERIRAAVAISVPCDLASSARRLADGENWLYMRRFLRFLRAKLRARAAMFPGQLDLTGVEKIRDFQEFDDRFTAPIHGFADAADYWRRCSSATVIGKIRVPTLILNARDDPFLTPKCFPEEPAGKSRFVYLEAPSHGGHVGFLACARRDGPTWAETRAVDFVERQITAEL